ncbi:hypothetical protein EST38_g5411 [Candolleomyces aberdarensis]|uniref:Uncharacterized protein n=1 Tax=Candolleomyces aberdarensis TaxID=2316362 RepID=A0A4Q2DM73_9AGAR|nr:hypothetical protein EST38_g5411 [Candolleomyces aberdarensis]
MPRTRNVSRSQWDTANARRDPRASKENGYDENEKENGGRVTRASTRAGSRRTVLGASTSAVAATNTTKAKAKGKGKEKPPAKGTLTKTEKLPLQDITERFLPAPESANRGYPQSEIAVHAEALSTHGPSASTLHISTARVQGMGAGPSQHASTSRAANVYPSSLPPSSPPSISSVVIAPQQPLEHNDTTNDLPLLPPSPAVPIETLSRRLFPHAEEADEEQPYEAWDDFDYVVKQSDRPSRPVPAPRSSDPFGFLALERKLKEERENEDVYGDEGEEDEETAGLILVADTSSPRPVRRLPRHLVLDNGWGSDDAPHEAEVQEEEVEEEEEEEFRPFPPTPHKSKARARHSCAGNPDDHLFSPHPSSCPSSPSPSKPAMSSAKRKAAASHIFEEEEEEEQEGDSSFMSQKIPGKKQAKIESDDEECSTRRQLRSRSVHQKAESSKATSVGAGRKGRSAKRGEGTATKKGQSKAKKRVVSNKVEDPDMEEWERERQVRLDYFHQLQEYEFETENVQSDYEPYPPSSLSRRND